jgi:hypothetical protein
MLPDQLGVRYKQRLPRGWSFPVGAEVLTTSLADVPHAAPAPLSFSHAEPYFLSDRKKRRSEDLPLPVLEVSFSRTPTFPDPPLERPMWTIRVRSVPSDLRKWVRECLMELGLPRLRTWLLQPFPTAALEASPQCRVLLQEDQKRLLWEVRSSHFERATIEELACSSNREDVEQVDAADEVRAVASRRRGPRS